jgi:hypothetical protein
MSGAILPLPQTSPWSGAQLKVKQRGNFTFINTQIQSSYSSYFRNTLSCCVSYLIGRDVHLLQMRVYCSKTNPSRDITLHSDKTIFIFIFFYIFTC